MKTQQLELIRFNPETATEDDFNDIIRLRIEAYKEINPHDPLPPETMLRQNLEMMSDHPIFDVQYYLVKNSQQIPVARLILLFSKPDSDDYENQKHMCLINVIVSSAYRRQGIASELLRFSLQQLDNTEITLVQADTDLDVGRAFATHLGAQVAIEARDSRVMVENLDWEMIEEWNADGEKSNPDVTIELFEGLPNEEHIEAYSQLYTETFNQQPFEEIEGAETTWTPEKLYELEAQMQALGFKNYIMITREANGDMSGLTELSYNPERAHRMGQGLTGVQENYRGRGLGKWLKAKMLLYMRDNLPTVEHIATTNASSNDAMLSINERLGFKLHKHNTAYKITVADLAEKLGVS